MNSYRSVFLAFILSLYSIAVFGQPGATVLQPAPRPTQAAPSEINSIFKEDLNSLSLAGSNLVPEPIQFGQRTETAEYTLELWRVQWRPDDPIDLYVILPKGATKPPVILYLSSYPAEEDHLRNPDFCRLVTKDGFAAVGFVGALTGQRYHNRPMREWFVSNLQESLATSTHDVQMVLNYLASRGDLDMSRVGMFGDGSGATITILAAAVDARIKVLDLSEPWGDWPEWLAKSSIVPEEERAQYLTPNFLTPLKTVEPTDYLPKLGSRPIRLQIISSDTVTPRIATDRFEAAMPAGGQVIRYDNTKLLVEHATSGKFFDWIKDQVGSAGSPAPTMRAASKR